MVFTSDRPEAERRVAASASAGIASGDEIPEISRKIQKIINPGGLASRGVSGIAYFPRGSSGSSRFRLKMSASALQYLREGQIEALSNTFAIERGRLEQVQPDSRPVAADKNHLIQGAFISLELQAMKELVGPEAVLEEGGSAIAFHQPEDGGIRSVAYGSGYDSPSEYQVTSAVAGLTGTSGLNQLVAEFAEEGKVFDGAAKAYVSKVLEGGGVVDPDSARAIWEFFNKPYDDGQGGAVVIGEALLDAIALFWAPIAQRSALLCPILGGELNYYEGDSLTAEVPLFIYSEVNEEVISSLAMSSLDPKDFFVAVSAGFYESVDGVLVKAGVGSADTFTLGYNAEHSEIYALTAAQVSGDSVSYVPERLDALWALNSSSSGRSLYANGQVVGTGAAVTGEWSSDSIFSILGGSNSPTSPGWVRTVFIANRSLSDREIHAFSLAVSELESVRRSRSDVVEPEAPPPGDVPVNTAPLVQFFEDAAIAAGGTINDWAIYIADASDESGNMLRQGGVGQDAIASGLMELTPFGSTGKNAYCLDGTNFFEIGASPSMDGGTWTQVVVAVQSRLQGARYIYNHSYSAGVPPLSGNLDEVWGMRGETFSAGFQVTFNRFLAHQADGAKVDADSRVPISQDMPFVSVGTWSSDTSEIQQRLNGNSGELGNLANAVPTGHQGSWIGAFNSSSGSSALRFHGCVAVVAWAKVIIPDEVLDTLVSNIRSFYGLPLGQIEAGFQISPPIMEAAVTGNLAIADFEISPPTLSMEIGKSPPAANDLFADAILVNSFPVTFVTNNFGATGEAGEPSHARYGGGDTDSQSLWWKITSANSGLLSISTQGSGVDTIIAVYTGTGVGNLLEVGQDASNGYSEILDLTVSANLEYFVAIETYPGEEGAITVAFDYSVVAGPSNDNFDRAIAITGDSYTITINNTYATQEFGEPDHDSSDGDVRSLWWTYTPAADGAMSLSLEGSDQDTVLAVYTGESLDGLSQVAFNDDGPNDSTSVISAVAVTAGTKYSIAADGYEGEQGNIKLSFSFFEASGDTNYTFDTALEITSDSFSGVYNNALAGGEVGEPDHAGAGLGDIDSKSLWWTYTPTVAGTAVIDLLGSNFDTALAVYTGSSVDNLSEVDSNDDGPVDSTSQLEVVMNPGTTYRIAADGYDGESGTVQFSFDFSPAVPPANDSFVNAIALTSNYLEDVDVETIATSGEFGEPVHAREGAGDIASKSVWYTFTPSQDGAITISTPNSTFDTVIGVYTGASVSGLAEVASDDNSGSGFRAEVANLLLTSGTTYHIAIDGKAGATGKTDVTLSYVVASPPANDSFANAEVLNISTFPSFTAETLFATGEVGEPAHASFALGGINSKSVWYTFTPASETFILVDVSSAEFNAVAAIYTGTNMSDLNLVIAGLGSASSPIIPGTTYFLAIDGMGGASGNVPVSIIAF